MSKYEWYMDLKYEPQMFISDPNMCNIIPNMNNYMDNQLVKNKQDLKPAETSDTAQESNEESTSEIGVCIVLGVFKGYVNSMDDVINFISA